MKQAIVLLSGGVDSSTTLAIAREKGYHPFCLTFNYGQKQLIELERADRVRKALTPKSKHVVIDIDPKIFGKSAITSDVNVPKHRSKNDILQGSIPTTYVPARNTIFLSYALAYAETIPANDIFLGVNIVDYSGYPDCRPAYIEAYNVLANLASSRAVQGEKITIHTPLLQLKKSSILQEGLRLGVDYSMTFSCYSPSRNFLSCGVCDACTLRLNAFKSIGVNDPIKYVTS